MKNNFNLFSYLFWLVVSTTTLLGVVIAIDMYFGYRELNGLSAMQDEQVMQAENDQPNEATNSKIGLHSPHELLGWKLNKNAQVSHILAGNFDVTYTTDGNGFRTTPARPFSQISIYFFGDSFTFGHGVADEETFASIISSSNMHYRGKFKTVSKEGPYGIRFVHQ